MRKTYGGIFLLNFWTNSLKPHISSLAIPKPRLDLHGNRTMGATYLFCFYTLSAPLAVTRQQSCSTTQRKYEERDTRPTYFIYSLVRNICRIEILEVRLAILIHHTFTPYLFLGGFSPFKNHSLTTKNSQDADFLNIFLP